MIKRYPTSIILVYFTIILICSSIFFIGTTGSADTTNGENDQPYQITDADIESFGLEWSYIRPDNSPDGNATSWKLRWSPDGKLIAVVYFDNTVIILDRSTGNPVQAFGKNAEIIMSDIGEDQNGKDGQDGQDGQTRCWGFTTDPLVPLLRACAWSPGGEYLAVSGDHKLVEVYDTTSWEKHMTLTGHVGSILSLDWSPDGTMIASGEGTDQVLPHNQADCKYNIKIWNVTTGEVIYTLSGHEDSVVSLSWSDDSKRLASASDDRNLKLWDIENGTLISTLGEGVGHSAGVLDVSWSPNQTLLVSGSRDFKIRLWDAELGAPLGKPWKDNNCVRSTQWHPSSRYILTSGVDQTIKIRNATNGNQMIIFTEAEETNSEVMSARWSPDGRAFAACSSRDATVRLYSLGLESQSGSTEEDESGLIGIPLFFLIAVIGIIVIYYTLYQELKNRRN